MNRAAVIIDLIVKGLRDVDKLGSLLLSIASNKTIVAGFRRVQAALGLVSKAVQQAVVTVGKFVTVFARLSQMPAVQRMFSRLASVVQLLARQFLNLQQQLKDTRTKLMGLDLALGILSIQLRSLAFLIRDFGLNFLRFAQRVVAGLKAISDAGGEVEFKFSELQAILGETSKATESFARLEEVIRRVGTTTSFTTSQVLDLATDLARAGFSTDEIADSIQSVVRLSEAGGVSSERAAEIAANIMHTFSLEARELARVNDVLVQTANASTSSVESLGTAMAYVGSIAETLGHTLEDTTAALGVLHNVGLQGSLSGTGLAQILSQLLNKAEKIDEILIGYGSSFERVNPEAHTLLEIMREFERINISNADVFEIFTERARKAFLGLMAQGSQTVEIFGNLNRQANGLAEETAKVRMQNLRGDQLLLKAEFEDLGFTLFNAVLPALTRIVDFLRAAVKEAKKWVEAHKDVLNVWTEVAAKTALVSAALAGMILSLSVIVRLVATISTAFSTLLNSFTFFHGSVAALGAGIASGKIGELFKWMIAGFSEFTAGAGGAAAFWKGFAQILGKVAIAFTLVFASVKLFVQNWKQLSAIMINIWNAFWKPLAKGVADFAGVFTTAADSFVGGFIEKALYVFQGVMEFLEPLLYSIGAALGMLISLIDQLSSVFVGAAIGAGIWMAASNPILLWVAALTAALTLLMHVLRPVGDFFFGWTESANRIADAHMNLAVRINDTVAAALAGYSQVENKLRALEKLANQLPGISTFNPNEAKDFADTIEDLRGQGMEFSPDSIADERQIVVDRMKELTIEMNKQSQLMNRESQHLAAMTGGEKFFSGRDNELEASIKGRAEGLKILQQRFDDLEKQVLRFDEVSEKLADFDLLRGFDTLDDLRGAKRAVEDELKLLGDRRQALLDEKKVVEESMEPGVNKRVELERLNRLLDENTNLTNQSTEKLKDLSIVNDQGVLDIINLGLSYEETSKLIQEYIKVRNQESEAMKANQATINEYTESFEDMADQMNRLANDFSQMDMTEQEKALDEIEDKFEEYRTQLRETIKLQEDFIKASTATNPLGWMTDPKVLAAMGILGQANDLLDDLNTKRDQALDEQHIKDQAKIQEEAAEKAQEKQDTLRKEQEEMYENAKDVEALLQLKLAEFDAETKKVLSEQFAGDPAGGQAYSAARAANRQALESEIRDKFKEKDKKAADRAKEAIDLENKGYEILLKKVQTARDLVALQLAMLKIQRMQEVEAAKSARRTMSAEESLMRMQKKRDAAAASGQDTTKMDLEVKRRTKILNLRRGVEAERFRAAGVDETDINSLNAATAGIQSTTSAAVSLIGAKIAEVRIAMDAMIPVFQNAAESWIDAFVASWEGSSSRLVAAVENTLKNLTPDWKPKFDPKQNYPAPVPGGKGGNHFTFNVSHPNVDESARQVGRRVGEAMQGSYV